MLPLPSGGGLGLPSLAAIKPALSSSLLPETQNALLKGAQGPAALGALLSSPFRAGGRRAPSALCSRKMGVETVKGVLRSNGLVGKMITSMVLMAIGDMVQQSGRESGGWDVKETVKMAAFGGLIGAPLLHFWIPLLEGWVPLRGKGIHLGGCVAKRVLLDQTLSSPVNLCAFLGYVSMFEQNYTPQHTVLKIKSELPELMPKTVMLWGPVHCLTYSVVPNRLRVLWIGSVNIVWGAVLSAVGKKTCPKL
mmetsp:Transcript_47843/g.74701  ORF Transcript_47843/g.74701 Transcript_47843/m.74701 type:complete len:250 (+) Transcript_47843:259-1008(+)